MRIDIIYLIALAVPFCLNAQSIQGDYFIPTSNGEITLSLITQDNVNYFGKMVGDEGSTFSVNAQINADGGIQGIVTGDQKELGLAAYKQGQTLLIVLVPVGVDGQPDIENAQKITMNRQEMSHSLPVKAGRPLMSSDNDSARSGTYYGNLNGTKLILSLNHEGTRYSGKIDADGYIYSIKGNLEGNVLNGDLIDLQTKGRMVCKGSIENGILNLTMSDISSGQSFQLIFSKNKAIANETHSTLSGNVSTSSEYVERDPNLIGNWLYSSSYTSGEFGFTTQYRLMINSDGTYLYGDAKMAGGGPASSVSSEGGGYTQGQWKTQNKTIYINEGSGWQSYAGYYVEGNSMLMKFSDGSKQLWERY